jgi:hypothetical protein
MHAARANALGEAQLAAALTLGRTVMAKGSRNYSQPQGRAQWLRRGGPSRLVTSATASSLGLT